VYEDCPPIVVVNPERAEGLEEDELAEVSAGVTRGLGLHQGEVGGRTAKKRYFFNLMVLFMYA
jgi:hypothetical protein